MNNSSVLAKYTAQVRRRWAQGTPLALARLLYFASVDGTAPAMNVPLTTDQNSFFNLVRMYEWTK